MAETTIPAEQISRRRREMDDNPGALGAGSTIHVRDFYGNTESWIIETFRVDGHETAFLQRNSADGAMRLVLPSEVMVAMARQRETVIARARRRAARQAVATRRERGDTIGNPAALAKARKSRRGL